MMQGPWYDFFVSKTDLVSYKPGSPEEADWLAEEVSASIRFVADQQRTRHRSGLEVQDPARAGAVLTALANGQPCRSIQKEHRIGSKTLSRMRRDHAGVLQRTHAWRAESATRLQLKASAALEAKLDHLMESEEAMSKANVRELVLCYGITSDQERMINCDAPVSAPDKKVSIEDAMLAIQQAKANVTRSLDPNLPQLKLPRAQGEPSEAPQL
jgi:hypothetical protein